jgi:tRNA (guanine-N7-)-methyltransferase
MPHIKVKPFDTAAVEAHIGRAGVPVTFRATSANRSDELWGVRYDDTEFLLHVKPFSHETLIKFDKITRPTNVELVKRALRDVSEMLELNIVASNIAAKSKTPALSPYEKRIEDFEDANFGFEKAALEVGFGSGRHLLHQAKKRPDTLFIGIEIHTPSAQQVLRQIDLQGLKNIWVVNYDARLLLEMLPSNLLEQIYVHFPVPWDKKPHRRVISPAFLREAMRTLRRGGTLEVRTDSENYFRYTLDTVFSVPKTDVRIRKNADLEITSKYEARWRRLQKDIYDVFVVALEDSLEREAVEPLRFEGVRIRDDLEKTLPHKAQVFDDHFVHIERVMRTHDGGTLVKCSFGSFDRPEHKYVLVEKNRARYFASEPVKTRVNAAAHQKLLEMLRDE